MPCVPYFGYFRPVALAVLAQAAINDVAILALQPPLSPPTPLHPRRGDQVSSTAIFGQRFVWGGVHAQRPTFKLAGNHGSLAHTDAACVHFEGGLSTLKYTPLKPRPQPAVEGRFEGWRLTVNSTTSNTRPHRAVGSPFPPGGAGEGLGVRVGVAAQELLHC